jgi:hypothetical protein
MAGASGNPKNPNWYAGGLFGVLAPGAGNVFYVNGGSDGPTDDLFDGLRPETPKQTIQAAIDLCTANNNDYVIILNYGGNGRAAETWPVVVDNDLMHIIGVGTVGQKWPVVRPNAPAAGDLNSPAFSVTADRVEIAGLEIGGGDAAGGIHPVDAGGVWGLTIHDCFFGVTGDSAGQDGIRVPAGSAAPYLTVYGCRFGTFITRDGVRFDANATRCMIGVPGMPYNYFHEPPGIAINVAAAVTSPGIHGNRIALAADTAGDAITLAATVTAAWVMDNVANFGDTDMVNNPYLDGAGAGANTWANNMQGISLTQPA